MTDLFKWSGGAWRGFDHEMSQFNSAFSYVNDNGNTRLKLDTSGTALMGKSPFNSPANISGEIYFELTSYPEWVKPFIAPLDASGASPWRFMFNATGGIVIQDKANTTKATTGDVPLNTKVRLLWLANATQITVRVYSGPSFSDLLVAETVAIGDFGLMDNFRLGSSMGTPIHSPIYFDNILITDGIDWLPVAEPTTVDATKQKQAFIGDSLTAMSGANGKYIYTELIKQGLKPENTYLWGVGGKKITASDLTSRGTIQNIRDARIQLGSVDKFVIALGTNDRPNADSTITQAIRDVLTEIGEGPEVVWVGLTSKVSATTRDREVNTLIQTELAKRPNSKFADWDEHIRSIDNGVAEDLWVPEDNTHMASTGYPIRAAYMVSQIAPSTDMSSQYELVADGVSAGLSELIYWNGETEVKLTLFEKE